MIDIGEDLVGAYLREVVGCPVIQFNVRTGIAQGEIDVVGLKLSGDRVAEVWLCEVSTHTSGLGGYRGDVAGKIRTKIDSVKAYADAIYPGVTRHIEVWSPKVRPAMLSKLDEVWSAHSDVQLIANEGYAERVRALAQIARKMTSYSDSPSFRLLQILTRLPINPLQSDSSVRTNAAKRGTGSESEPLEVWNRATAGTPYSPLAGDVALARVMLFHGYAENGGLPHAVEMATETETGLHDVIAAYRYFDLDAAADLIHETFRAQNAVWESENEAAEARLKHSSSNAYATLDIETQLTAALTNRLKEDPAHFA